MGDDDDGSAFARALSASGAELRNASSFTYTRPQPSCIIHAASGTIYGGMVGGAWGVASSLSTVAGSGLASGTLTSYVARNALRTAGGFAAWSGVFQGSKCVLARARGTDDIVGAGTAGAFTGAVLTVAATNGNIAAARPIIRNNAAGSALVAIVFAVMYRL